ncbi:MAG: hypothetical protein JJU36_06870 [Phycisphaeraceae bacterium]|nr:hypothetical protein [Phycisphaeraceae bacterium]
MPVDRPTFSEFWYRVADLKPRLRSVVQIVRQSYRGEIWHVLCDPAGNQYFRLDEPGYHFVGMLDGRRTIREAWEACNQLLGDSAPTQGEAIQLMGQLHVANLLQGDIPQDAASLFERQRKRISREFRGYISNFLFIRFPLFDPNRLLEMWVGALGWLFGPVGWVLWLILIGAGLATVAGRTSDLLLPANQVLDPSNLLWLYLGFGLVKALHELGHGLACKRYGLINGGGGDVHTLGIMLLVFMPVPYVDASSSWAFRSKWQRAFVGAAGMYVELAVAAVAAMVWASTNPGTAVNAIAWNMIFVASVSTILFNANPLLRFDGYYILCDLLESPNLAQRSKDYFYYLVKKYIYKVRRPRDPSQSSVERPWLLFYWAAALVYRVFISISILWFVAQSLFFVGVVLALAAITMWVIVPLGKLIKYLLTNHELNRTRGRAVAATGGFALSLVVLLGMVPMPDYSRAQGIVEPVRLAGVFAAGDGFLALDGHGESGSLPASGQWVQVGHSLGSIKSLETERRLGSVRAQIERTQALLEIERRRDGGRVAVLLGELEVLEQEARTLERELERLAVPAPMDGAWISDRDRMLGGYVQRGQALGRVAAVDELRLRLVTTQDFGPRLERELGLGAKAEVRLLGRPDVIFAARIHQFLPAGSQESPSAALSYHVGGAIQTAMDDPDGRRTVDRIFEVVLEPETIPRNAEGEPLIRPGQRIVARFKLPDRPLASQLYLRVRQLVQRKLIMGDG